MSGSEVLYQLNPTTGPGGGNAQGQAVLLDNVTEDQHGNVTGYTLTDYTGHTHAWFDNKVNPNGATGNLQTWGAETVSFNGSAPDGSQISISVSEGGGTSATGHPSGWLHVKIVCS